MDTSARTPQVERFLRQAIDLAAANVTQRRGRPFGAVLVKDDRVIATGVNEVDATGDPTAHAELQAIRAASRVLAGPRLDGCVMYASGHPCPMCLSAMYLTGVSTVYCAFSLEAADPYGLSSAAIYSQLAKAADQRALEVHCIPVCDAAELYGLWLKQGGRA